ncbi:hypothetical protein BCD50_09110 [Neisseria meningitidis]|nr:hypothetical protein [Neisseria meningitidis]
MLIHYTVIRDAQFVETAKQVEVDAGNEAVFEFGIGEAVPLSEQDTNSTEPIHFHLVLQHLRESFSLS